MSFKSKWEEYMESEMEIWGGFVCRSKKPTHMWIFVRCWLHHTYLLFETDLSVREKGDYHCTKEESLENVSIASGEESTPTQISEDDEPSIFWFVLPPPHYWICKRDGAPMQIYEKKKNVVTAKSMMVALFYRCRCWPVVPLTAGGGGCCVG